MKEYHEKNLKVLLNMIAPNNCTGWLNMSSLCPWGPGLKKETSLQNLVPMCLDRRDWINTMYCNGPNDFQMYLHIDNFVQS
jgi:hypothetical protein